jgi:hypothetical protein
MAATAALMMVVSTAFAGEAYARSSETPADESASDGVTLDLETAVAETLRENPGSIKTGENTVLLEPGVMVALPSDADVSAQQSSLNLCTRGWLCAWPHSDYRGPMLAVRDGTYIDYRAWWWDTSTGAILDCRGGCTGVDWYWDMYMRNYANNITSIYNNTSTMTWAPFWSPRNNANYYAYNGAPSAYVGSKWNDSFTAACAC